MAAADRHDVVRHRLSDHAMRGYTPLQTLFLLRLKALVEKRRQFLGTLTPADWRMRLIDKCLYSTYSDCRQAGLAEEAQKLVRQARQAADS